MAIEMTDLEKQALIALLHNIVSTAVPKASTVKKYGGTLYTLHPDEKEAQFCGIFPYKAHVQLSFARGTDLDDPHNLLQGGGKFRRHLNYSHVDEVDPKPLKRFLKAAAKLKG